MVKAESAILKNWKAKLALLSAIVVPTVSATGAFFGLKTEMVEKEAAINSRISSVELRTEQNFADKPSMNKMQDNLQHLRDDVSDMKNDLKTLLRKSH